MIPRLPAPGAVGASLGVAVGKFNPPHLGHLHLVLTAAQIADRIVVLLCDRQDQTIGAGLRRTSLLDSCPSNVEVFVTPDDLPEAPEPWAARALQILGRRPDVAFTSEDWGPAWAEAMGARHVMVDSERSAFPISGTALRADLGASFGWLVPGARAALARRVVLVGAESTGKSTLAEALAAALGTVWVPEYGRWYWQGRRHLADQRWTIDEFDRIAACQHRVAADLARKAMHGIVIGDTDALATAVWLERYLGTTSRAIDHLVQVQRPALYLVCAPDFDWVQDGTRDSGVQRQAMHEVTLRRVEATGLPWLVLTGSHDERLERAVDAVRPLTLFQPLR